MRMLVMRMMRGGRRRRWVVVIVRVHAVSIATLLGGNKTLDHESRLAEPRNLLLHGNAVLAVGSATKHGLLLLIIKVASPAGEKALESRLGTVVAARSSVAIRATDGPANSTARFGGEAVDAAVNVGDANDGANGESNGSHAQDHDDRLRWRTMVVVAMWAVLVMRRAAVMGRMWVVLAVLGLHGREVVVVLSVAVSMLFVLRRRGRMVTVARRRGRKLVRRLIMVRGRRERSLVSWRRRSLSVVGRRWESSLGWSMARGAERRSVVRRSWVRMVSGELVLGGSVRMISVGARAVTMGTVAVKPFGAKVTSSVLDLLGERVHNALDAVAIPEGGESGRGRGRSTMATATTAKALLDGHFLLFDKFHKFRSLGVKEFELLDLSLELIIGIGHLSLVVALTVALVSLLKGTMEIEHQSRRRLSESQKKFGDVNTVAVDLVDGKAK